VCQLETELHAKSLFEALAQYASPRPLDKHKQPPTHEGAPEDEQLAAAVDNLSLAIDNSSEGRSTGKKGVYRMESMFLLSAWAVYLLYYLGSTIREEMNWSYS
jgi:hypothetical protein